MNSKHYVGKRVSTLDLYDEIGPITGVAILLDDNNEILAGSEDGYVFEVDCKYGTPEMADDILAVVADRTYKGFRATGAILDPTAELGDGITVDGMYSVLGYRSVNFGPGHMSEIAAPGESTLAHEYNYKTPTERALNRKIAQTYSQITKTAEEIRLQVFGEDGPGGESLRAEIAVELDKISSSISGYIDEEYAQSLIDQTLKEITLSISSASGGSSISLTSGDVTITSDKVNLCVAAANVTGELTAATISADRIKGGEIDAACINVGTLNLSGVISFEDLSDSEDIMEQIESAGGLSEEEVLTKITSTLVASPTIKGGEFYDIDGMGRLTLSYDDDAWLIFETVENSRQIFSVCGTDFGDKDDITFMTFADTTIFQHYAATGEISLVQVDITSPLSNALDDSTIVAKLKSVLGLS